jgi:hypothetical protein
VGRSWPGCENAKAPPTPETNRSTPGHQELLTLSPIQGHDREEDMMTNTTLEEIDEEILSPSDDSHTNCDVCGDAFETTNEFKMHIIKDRCKQCFNCDEIFNKISDIGAFSLDSPDEPVHNPFHREMRRLATLHIICKTCLPEWREREDP